MALSKSVNVVTDTTGPKIPVLSETVGATS
jgi:hypothetical protein